MSHQVKVATYNIRKAVGLDQRRNPARIINVLNEIDADIITLQEVDRRFGARVSALPLAMLEAETPWMPVPLHFRPAAIGWHGNAILVRKGIEVRNVAPIEMPTLEPRGAVMAELSVAGHSLRVIGVHLDLSGLWRRKQVRALLAAIDACPRLMPTVMMGDFNQWSDSGALSELAFHHHRIVQTPKSFHTSRPVARLDRIVVSHDIQVSAADCHVSLLSKQASDHLPVWAALHIG
ncbi:endonuclease [Sphingorhabdus sp. IMCC26285]|jgi:endonuclease/exonuclease/phosphatase family metal-dependent hydrolase|uniref:Endonuclease n=1 Tax=Sphingorhabdus profundilacus TaxID=2509718 RepID=A0A6I4LYA1_9SPHN|nr:endonuclease/exonuclease/phosphatase family protein [Sphingorhabdus profundilacus]MVZ98041.1 endonuclease [Sphingorhabdus profundilacus]